MATIDYPATLPDFRLGKQRQEVQTYRTSQPFNGPLFIEKITDESPVVWDVTITCKTQAQARVFQAFLRLVKNGTPFNKDILIEEGFSTHEVRFIEEPLSPRQLSPHVWVYTGVIYATKLIQPDALVDDNLIILYAGQSGIIDTAVNVFWPKKPDDIVNPFARLANPLVHLFTNDKTVEKLTNGTLTTDRATTGTQVGRTAGLVETIAIDTIREEAEGYLIEGASTNFLLRSEEFDNAAWVKTGATVTANTIISPDGNVTADTINATAAATQTLILQLATVTSGVSIDQSFFIKLQPSSSLFVAITFISGVTDPSPAWIDLSDGSIARDDQGIATVKSLINNWIRVDINSVTNATSTQARMYLTDRTTSTGWTTTASGTETVSVWGAQLEQLPFASSYIPTNTTAVTRAADDVSIPFGGNLPAFDSPSTILLNFNFLSPVDPGFTQGLFGVVGESFRYIRQNTGGTLFSAWTTTLDVRPSYESSGNIAITNDGVNTESFFNTSSTDTSTVGSDPGAGTSLRVGNIGHGTQVMYGHVNNYMIYDFDATPTEIALLQG